MNGTSGFQEVRSSTSRLPSYRLLYEQRHRFGEGSWRLLRTHDIIARSQASAQSEKRFLTPFACLHRTHDHCKRALHFFPSFTLLIQIVLTSLVFSWTAQAQTLNSLGPSCKSDTLNLAIQRWTQEEGPWCWATSAATVMDFHGETRAPCFVVNAVLRAKGSLDNGTDCCDLSDRYNFENGCLQGGRVSDVLNTFAFSFIYRPKSPEGDPLPFKTASEEFCNERPLISKIKTGGTLSHTAIVYGYAIDPSGMEQVYVHDPQDDSSEPWIIPYDVFFKSERYVHLGEYLSICNTNKNGCPVR